MPDALIPHAGDALAAAASWAELPEGELKRRAATAATNRDADQLVELTLAYLRIHGTGCSASTADNYARAVRILVADWPHVNLLRATPNAGALWIRRLEASGLGPATVAGRLAGARALYRALRWSEATTVDPFRDVRPPRDSRAKWERRFPYPDGDLDKLLAVATGSDRLLLLLGAHAGLRVSEILALTIADCDLTRQTLVVQRGKGGKRRTVPLSATLVAELSGRADPLFPYRTRAQACNRMKALCVAAGVEYKAIHSLRHAAGTWIVAHGGSLEDARELLGHSSVATTEIYAHHASDRMQRLIGDR